jgi:hypothetical protein
LDSISAMNSLLRFAGHELFELGRKHRVAKFGEPHFHFGIGDHTRVRSNKIDCSFRSSRRRATSMQRLYDRRREQVNLDEVERISI